MYKIGSHDTMTYLPPKYWWLKPFHFMAKCQTKTIQEQYEAGVRMFDMRIKFNEKEWKWEFAHGYMVFKCDDIEEVFDWLDKQNGSQVYIRLLLEYNRPVKNIDDISELFKWYSILLCNKFLNLEFFEFRRKYDWKQLNSFEGMAEPDIHQATSSTTGNILDDWFPALFAKTFNKNILEQGTTHDWLLMDFI